MNIPAARHDLEALVSLAEAKNLEEVKSLAQKALEALSETALLTTTEAIEILGIGSVNTLKALVKRFGLPYSKVGNRMMIPLTTITQLQEHALVSEIQASDALHDEAAELGDEELSSDELTTLSESRPGQLPWKMA